jgi:hypothetical protein
MSLTDDDKICNKKMNRKPMILCELVGCGIYTLNIKEGKQKNNCLCISIDMPMI